MTKKKSKEQKTKHKLEWARLLVGPEGVIAAIGGLGLLITSFVVTPEQQAPPPPTVLTECPGIHELIIADNPFRELPPDIAEKQNLALSDEYTKCVIRVNQKQAKLKAQSEGKDD